MKNMFFSTITETNSTVSNDRNKIVVVDVKELTWERAGFFIQTR